MEYLYTRPGYAYVPYQNANEQNIYSPEKGLTRGTIFPELDIPLDVYGEENYEAEGYIYD